MTALISVSTRFGLTLLAIAALPLMGCDADNPVAPSGPQTMFTITIQNVSTPGTLTTDRAMGAIPLSPGVYAVFTGTDPAFTIGGRADVGTERIAEDGFPGPPLPLGTKSTLLAATRRVTASGVFQSPGGPDNGPAILPGESATFTVSAAAPSRLQIETMFVQSNDWFYAFGGGGLALFSGNTPVSGDVTGELVLYDAGTEADTAPGTGAFQKPVQDPMATNVGPADPNTQIRPATQSGFAIPPTPAVLRITITPQ